MLDPKQPIGFLAIKKPAAKKKASGVTIAAPTEKIYRRRDVKLVRSARAWYQLGRIIKVGQVPKKHVMRRKMPRSQQERSAVATENDDLWGEPVDDEKDEPLTGLYALEQTEIYIPPPIIEGIVPRNTYGNIDVYVPSMVPKGGVLLKYPHIEVAAKMVGIDYAPAVTGFDFGGTGDKSRPAKRTDRRGMATARIDGIVIAAEYEEAVRAVYEQMVEEQKEEDKTMAILRALMSWRRYVTALRIKARLEKQHGKVEDLDQEERDSHKENEGGFLDEEDMSRATGTINNEFTNEVEGGGFIDDDTGGGFLPDDDENEGGFIHENTGGGFLPDNDNTGGGFIDEDLGGGFIDEDTGGGFLPDDDDKEGGFTHEESGGGFLSESEEAGGFLSDEDAAFTKKENGKSPPDEEVIELSSSDHGNESGFLSNEEASPPEPSSSKINQIETGSSPPEKVTIEDDDYSTNLTHSESGPGVVDMPDSRVQDSKNQSLSTPDIISKPLKPSGTPASFSSKHGSLMIPANIELVVVPSAKSSDTLSERIMASSTDSELLQDIRPIPVLERVPSPLEKSLEVSVPAPLKSESEGVHVQSKAHGEDSEELLEDDDGNFFPDSMSESELYQEYEDDDIDE